MSKQLTAEVWQDSLGQDIRPGDFIAVSTVNDKSPQTVFAQIKQINTTNAKGEQYYLTYKGPARTFGADYDVSQLEKTVVVSAVPVYDGRGFYRWSAGHQRAIGYSIIGNITKLSDDQVAYLKKKQNEEAS